MATIPPQKAGHRTRLTGRPAFSVNKALPPSPLMGEGWGEGESVIRRGDPQL